MLTEQMQDFQWFKDNYKKISQQHNNTYLAIKNKTILGSYPTYEAGVRETQKKEPLGTFIIQHCNGDETGYTGYIASTNFMPHSEKGVVL